VNWLRPELTLMNKRTITMMARNTLSHGSKHRGYWSQYLCVHLLGYVPSGSQTICVRVKRGTQMRRKRASSSLFYKAVITILRRITAQHHSTD